MIYESEKIMLFSIAEAKTMRAQLKKREEKSPKSIVIEKRQKKRFKLQKEAGKKAHHNQCVYKQQCLLHRMQWTTINEGKCSMYSQGS